jgi:hypothetical protein
MCVVIQQSYVRSIDQVQAVEQAIRLVSDVRRTRTCPPSTAFLFFPSILPFFHKMQPLSLGLIQTPSMPHDLATVR